MRIPFKSWAVAILRIRRMEEEQLSQTKVLKELFEIQKRQGEKMESLQVDVDRLKDDAVKFKAFVQKVKDYIGANPVVNTTELEAAITDLEGSLAEGNTAVDGANQQPQA